MFEINFYKVSARCLFARRIYYAYEYKWNKMIHLSCYNEGNKYIQISWSVITIKSQDKKLHIEDKKCASGSNSYDDERLTLYK
ncbi:MAG: hypothetical protein ACLRR3_11960 [Eubacterium sp.]